MREPWVVAVIGKQGSGKTTLVEQMIQTWSTLGLMIGAVKHDGHAAAGKASDWEKPGSDTERFAAAGAPLTMVSGGGQCMLHVRRGVMDTDADRLCGWLLRTAREQGIALDGIVVEGLKRSNLPKIAVVEHSSDVDWLAHERFPNVRALVCPPAVAPLADPCWRVYHDTDIHRLCVDVPILAPSWRRFNP